VRHCVKHQKIASKDNKTKSYVKLDGKDVQKLWVWATKTKAVAARKGWLEGITNDVMLNRNSKKKAAVLKNVFAYNYLVMACMDHAYSIKSQNALITRFSTPTL